MKQPQEDLTPRIDTPDSTHPSENNFLQNLTQEKQ